LCSDTSDILSQLTSSTDAATIGKGLDSLKSLFQ
jgi:hypothetical protein